MLLDPIKDEGGGGQAPTRKADSGPLPGIDA
jgi:hypothetical protein